MKNEPAITYNHIDEEGYSTFSGKENQKRMLPVSLYLILIADVLLIGAILYITVKILF